MIITLAEAKAQLNLEPDQTDDDALVSGYIAAVAQHFDSQYDIIADQTTGRSWTFDRFGPLMALPGSVDPATVAIAYYDRDGTLQAFTDFRCVPTGRHFRLLPKIGSCWPYLAHDRLIDFRQHRHRHDAPQALVMVTATAGYALDPTTSDDVPEDIKVAARMIVAHWYQNRETAAAALTELPFAAAALLNPYQLRVV